MAIKAVDVVLLPSARVTDLAIEINSELVRKFQSQIILNKVNCLPHISLAMGGINDGDLPAIEQVLKKISDGIVSMELVIIYAHIDEDFCFMPVSSFGIEKTAELLRLHENVITQLSPYLTNDVKGSALYNSEVAQSTLSWIRDYRRKASFENFWPHITLGYGKARFKQLPVRFKPSKLALCHLGNNCTCREVLYFVEL